ncbi:MAG: LLM class F420-dependent oxidoreductase [Nocardioides sp.]|nr:LLM class F420-dependent oxidoreductase [Nocardioides sp.]
MKLSMPLSYFGNPRDTADEVVKLEKAGLDQLWVAEPYGFDAVSLLGYLAAKTERVELGSGILNIYSRTPATLVQTAAGLDNVSEGRAILGLGASGPQVIEGFHGVAYDKPLKRTREIIDIVRSGLRHERLVSDGLYKLPLPADAPGATGLGKPLKLLNRPERADVPIWVASLGPANVAMTAEIADGWLPFLYLPEKAGDVWGEALAKGRARRPAGLAPLQTAAGGLLAITEDKDEIQRHLDSVRGLLALYVGGMGAKGKNFYHNIAVAYGFEEEADKIQELYLSGHKRDAEAVVPQAWLEKANLVGPASYVQERIAAYAEAGVTSLNVNPAFGTDAVAAVEQTKGWLPS